MRGEYHVGQFLACPTPHCSGAVVEQCARCGQLRAHCACGACDILCHCDEPVAVEDRPGGKVAPVSASGVAPSQQANGAPRNGATRQVDLMAGPDVIARVASMQVSLTALLVMAAMQDMRHKVAAATTPQEAMDILMRASQLMAAATMLQKASELLDEVGGGDDGAGDGDADPGDSRA